MDHRLGTQVVHAGATHTEGAVVQPVFQTANFLQSGATTYGALRYMRLSNSPQHQALHRKLAAIEQAEAALTFTSGMAAVSTALLSVLKAGDHLLIQHNVYGGTETFLHDLAGLGIETTRIDGARPETWEVRPNTRAIYVEAMSNPLLQVPELQAVVDLARSRGLVSIIDNTFQSPVGFRPVPFGFDLVVHSATKYLNGHSDIVAGVVAGSTERMASVAHLQHHLGSSLDAHACFLLDRGLKTLALRVPRQAATAVELARVLREHPAVAHVRHPGLPEDPSHARAARWFDHFGAMITFEATSEHVAETFVAETRLALNAASLGGVESLVVRPARSSHIGMPEAARMALGITDRLVRLSIGVEDPDDLRADFVRALDAALG